MTGPHATNSTQYSIKDEKGKDIKLEHEIYGRKVGHA